MVPFPGLPAGVRAAASRHCHGDRCSAWAAKASASSSTAGGPTPNSSPAATNSFLPTYRRCSPASWTVHSTSQSSSTHSSASAHLAGGREPRAWARTPTATSATAVPPAPARVFGGQPAIAGSGGTQRKSVRRASWPDRPAADVIHTPVAQQFRGYDGPDHFPAGLRRRVCVPLGGDCFDELKTPAAFGEFIRVDTHRQARVGIPDENQHPRPVGQEP